MSSSSSRPQLTVPSPTPFWPSSSSSRSRKLRGTLTPVWRTSTTNAKSCYTQNLAAPHPTRQVELAPISQTQTRAAENKTCLDFTTCPQPSGTERCYSLAHLVEREAVTVLHHSASAVRCDGAAALGHHANPVAPSAAAATRLHWPSVAPRAGSESVLLTRRSHSCTEAPCGSTAVCYWRVTREIRVLFFFDTHPLSGPCSIPQIS